MILLGLTGSIGIFAMLPDLSGPMNKLGLAVDGVGTTPLSGGLDPRRRPSFLESSRECRSSRSRDSSPVQSFSLPPKRGTIKREKQKK